MTTGRKLGKVECFLSTKLNDDDYFIVCIMGQMDQRADRKYSSPSGSMVVASDEVLAAVIWTEEPDGFRVIPPAIAATWPSLG